MKVKEYLSAPQAYTGGVRQPKEGQNPSKGWLTGSHLILELNKDR